MVWCINASMYICHEYTHILAKLLSLEPSGENAIFQANNPITMVRRLNPKQNMYIATIVQCSPQIYQ